MIMELIDLYKEGMMEKIDRVTNLTTSDSVSRELILRLLDKSDELVEVHKDLELRHL